MAAVSPAERVMVTDRVNAPLRRLRSSRSARGLVLVPGAALAFGWANSPWAQAYFGMQNLLTALVVSAFHLELSLARFVNDALMAIFFFVVGLEIKREFLAGELAGLRGAALPVAGAVGGLVAPALIYVALNFGEPTLRGWGVPMATDIASAVAVLALVGDRVPLGLKVFLLTLAMVDDLGAVMVIELFYTASLNATAPLLSLGAWALAVLYGRFGHGRAGVFFLIGLVCWYFMLESGVHVTIAGALMALAIALGGRLRSRDLDADRPEMRPPSSGGLDLEIERTGYPADRAQSPLMTFEHGLSPWVAFVIMPAFVVVNAGVTLGDGGHGGEAEAAAHAAEASLIGVPTIGAFLALLVGGLLGIVGIGCLAGVVLLARAFADAPPQTAAAEAGH